MERSSILNTGLWDFCAVGALVAVDITGVFFKCICSFSGEMTYKST